MKKIYTVIVVFLLVAVSVFFFFSRDRAFRGRVESSKDGKSYLVVTDDNGGHCGPIKLDGNIWRYGINAAGEVSSGVHGIECGSGEIQFEIPAGKIFYFDYWGP